jgi:hypothetical protein
MNFTKFRGKKMETIYYFFCASNRPQVATIQPRVTKIKMMVMLEEIPMKLKVSSTTQKVMRSGAEH